MQFLAGGKLAGLQKCFDKFAVTADGHVGKFFEPWAFRHFRFSCGANSPSVQVDPRKCSGGERGQANDREGEVEDCDAGFAAWLFAVKATVDFLAQFLDFSGIVRVCHAPGEFRQFLAG